MMHGSTKLKFREISSKTPFHTFGEFAVDTAHLAHSVAKSAAILFAHLYFPASAE
jgi:mRNA degradation ribonuclease J1/J2